MKNKILFILIVFAFSCSEEKIEKAIEVIAQPKFDTLAIGAKVYNMENLSDTNFTFNKFEYPDESDSISIEKNKDLASRVGDTLFLKCDNGKTVKLKNNVTDGDDLTAFNFKYIDKEINAYVVFCYYYESYAVWLINKHSADTLITISYPVVSPDKKQFVCANIDLEAGFTCNGLQLFKNENNVYVLNGLRELTDWGPEKVMWKNDTTLIINGSKMDGKGGYTSFYKALYVK